MNDKSTQLTAIAALLLAFLFPMYWLREFWQIAEHGGEAIYRNASTLSWSDGLFLFNGFLSVFVYLGFKRFLNDRFAFNHVDIPLILLAVVTGVFTLGTLAMDAVLHFYGDQLFLSWHLNSVNGIAITLIISLVFFGVLDLVLGIMLLIQARTLGGGILAFAIITVIQGVVELSIVFAYSTVAVYPVALIVLAITLLQRPQELEVV